MKLVMSLTLDTHLVGNFPAVRGGGGSHAFLGLSEEGFSRSLEFVNQTGHALNRLEIGRRSRITTPQPHFLSVGKLP